MVRRPVSGPRTASLKSAPGTFADPKSSARQRISCTRVGGMKCRKAFFGRRREGVPSSLSGNGLRLLNGPPAKRSGAGGDGGSGAGGSAGPGSARGSLSFGIAAYTHAISRGVKVFARTPVTRAGGGGRLALARRRAVETASTHGRARMRLENKVAIITGAGQGIGEAYARRFASEGARVVVADINAEKGEAVARDLAQVFERVDVSSEDDTRRLCRAVAERFGRIDVLI